MFEKRKYFSIFIIRLHAFIALIEWRIRILMNIYNIRDEWQRNNFSHSVESHQFYCRIFIEATKWKNEKINEIRSNFLYFIWFIVELGFAFLSTIYLCICMCATSYKLNLILTMGPSCTKRPIHRRQSSSFRTSTKTQIFDEKPI